jgi:hypothetical protein
MIEILIGKIQRPFLAKFLPASLLCFSAATWAEKSGEWIGNYYNLVADHNRSENGLSCMGRFVLYHPITVTSKDKNNTYLYLWHNNIQMCVYELWIAQIDKYICVA